MEIKLDKDFIRASKLNEVKAAAKEFKARYTDSDLITAFCDAVGYDVIGEVVSAKVECYEAHSYGVDVELAVRVELIVFNWSEFYRITYYADSELNIDTEERTGNGIHNPFYLYECETFAKVK